MYERFTDRARKVMQLANEEARRLEHEYIGSEHILLGLVREGSGVAAHVLTSLDVDLPKIRLEVEKILQTGPGMVTMGRLPQTPRAKNIIKYAMEEARKLNHNYVGTEHLLLGLLREVEGVAAQVLMNLSLKLEAVREEVLNILGHGIDEANSDDSDKIVPTTDSAAIEQRIRHAVQMYWLGLPKDKRNVDEFERRVRRLVDRALRDLRDDLDLTG